MKKNSLFERQRQSMFAIIMILIKFVRVMVRQLWPVILVLLFNRGDKFQTYVGIFVAGAALISLVGSVIAYFKFYYYIKDDQLFVEKGLLKRTNLNIPFSRIQTVDFEQNVIHQAFNVVRVNIDSAGSQGSEVSLDALEMSQAIELRDYILAQKATQEQVVTNETADTAEEIILKLKPVDLVKIGVSQNHIRTAGILLGGVWVIADNVNQALRTDVFVVLADQADSMVAISILFWAALISLFILIAIVITLVRTVLRYYDLRFIKTTTGFKLIAGLLTRKERSAQKHKVQIISWSTNPIRRIFRMFQLKLYQAASMDVMGGKGITVPGCFQDQVDHTIASVIPDALNVSYEMHRIHRLARFRFALFAGLLPCLAISAIAYFSANFSLFFGWLYFPLALVMAHLYYQKRRLQLHADYMITSQGIFGLSSKILEIYKVQAVKLSQSFYQWRKDLATVTVYTASGDVKIPFIPMPKAEQLRDYILFRVESDARSWM